MQAKEAEIVLEAAKEAEVQDNHSPAATAPLSKEDPSANPSLPGTSDATKGKLAAAAAAAAPASQEAPVEVRQRLSESVLHPSTPKQMYSMYDVCCFRVAHICAS